MSRSNGTIIKGVGGFYYVDTGAAEIECRARGKFRKTDVTPIVGDKVSIEISADGTGSIEEIYPRSNSLIRPGVANIDMLVSVSAAAAPQPDRLLVDKLLVIAELKGIEAAVCVNKTDLADKAEAEDFLSAYRKAGYKTVAVCARSGEGFAELSELIRGKTTAFAGLSGVGKSSLLSLITGRKLEVGDVSKIERGRHTTRHVELIAANGGYVFDTPGFSRLEIEGVRAENLRLLFPEIARFEGQCRFRGCLHIAEPDCAVAAAAKNAEIAQSRLNSYREIYSVLKNIKEWEKEQKE